jgi:predicted nucleic acid-binding protein
LIIVDTSGLIAALDASDPHHAAVSEAMAEETPPFLLSPFVLAELDYLVLTRWGVDREMAVLEEMGRGAFELAPFDAGDLEVARKLIARFADLEIGLADASIVVLAHRHRTRKVVTLDHRHFRVLRGPGGKPFTILPGD